MDPIAAFVEYENASLQAIEAAEDLQALEAVRIEYLGKNGDAFAICRHC